MRLIFAPNESCKSLCVFFVLCSVKSDVKSDTAASRGRALEGEDCALRSWRPGCFVPSFLSQVTSFALSLSLPPLCLSACLSVVCKFRFGSMPQALSHTDCIDIQPSDALALTLQRPCTSSDVDDNSCNYMHTYSHARIGKNRKNRSESGLTDATISHTLGTTMRSGKRERWATISLLALIQTRKW